jgi:PAS domain S-box-containing protein
VAAKPKKATKRRKRASPKRDVVVDVADIRLQLKHRELELNLLSQISKTFWSAIDHHTLSTHLFEMLKKRLDVHALALLLTDDAGHKLILASHNQIPEQWGRQMRDHLLLHYAKHANHPISATDVTVVKAIPVEAARTRRKVPTHLHALPLTVLDRTLGMIGLSLPEHLTLEESDELFFNIVANEVAMFAENARIQQDLLDERNRLASILHSMTSAVLVVDGHQHILLSNPLMNTIFNLHEGKVLGARLGDVIQNGDIQSLFGEIAKQPNEYMSRDVTITNQAQGTLLVMRANLAKVRSHSGVVTGAVMVLNDITREKEIDRVRSEFVSVVSHELRTPMAAIKEAVSLIIDGVTGPVNERQVKFLDMAKRNIDRLTGIINDLLDLSKIESGKMTLLCEKVSASSIVDEVVATFEPVAHEKEIALLADVNEHVPEMHIDQSKIAQVLANLVSNAIKFTPNKGAVTVSARLSSLRQKSVEFCVADTGIGIDPKDYRKLFQKFQQVDSSLSRMAGGTGLGLAISKEIVELHGGRIWVQSDPGRGSKFCFTLPVNGKGDGVRERFVLFASHDGTLQTQISTCLKEHGFEVVGAKNGAETMEKVNTLRPDIILLDVRLPDMDGFELCRRLKEDLIASLIPVVLITAVGQEKEIWRALSLGVNGYLVRPVSARDVLSTINKLIQ